jgi:hypothetical protein
MLLIASAMDFPTEYPGGDFLHVLSLVGRMYMHVHNAFFV